MKTLLTWLGTNDVEQMQKDQLASISTLVLYSPERFDEICILASGWENDEPYQFSEWLKGKAAKAGRSIHDISVKSVRLASPIDFPSITKIIQKHLPAIVEKSDEVFINLSSGTPAMSTVSVLLGKSYSKCRFVQSTRDRDVVETEIPIDFASEYKKSSDSSLQQQFAKQPVLESSFSNISAKSEVMKKVIRNAKRLAPTDLPALILGESGTGKEVMATAIHQASLRLGQPFKAVNCGALPKDLVDSILFGHVKGAFTGAGKDHPGLFEQADGGTLFLDEVGELPADIQVKLLRALQQKEVTRVGDTETRNIDVRIIAATHRNLFDMVAQGSFREDLFYRLAVGVIELPPLRSRLDDLPVLIDELLDEIQSKMQNHPDFSGKKISKEAKNFALSYPWPGNIRELWNTLQRATLWSEGDEITASDLSESVLSIESPSSNHSAFNLPGDINQYIDNIKKKYIPLALDMAGGNKSQAAKLLGLESHQNLSHWIKKLEIDV